jgi:protein subunit release factor A
MKLRVTQDLIYADRDNNSAIVDIKINENKNIQPTSHEIDYNSTIYRLYRMYLKYIENNRHTATPVYIKTGNLYGCDQYVFIAEKEYGNLITQHGAHEIVEYLYKSNNPSSDKILTTTLVDVSVIPYLQGLPTLNKDEIAIEEFTTSHSIGATFPAHAKHTVKITHTPTNISVIVNEKNKIEDSINLGLEILKSMILHSVRTSFGKDVSEEPVVKDNIVYSYHIDPEPKFINHITKHTIEDAEKVNDILNGNLDDIVDEYYHWAEGYSYKIRNRK